IKRFSAGDKGGHGAEEEHFQRIHPTMPAPRFGETDEEVQNEAQKSILRVFHALILSDFFGASALEQNMVLLPGAGIYAPKDLKEARHHSCLSAGMVFEAAPQACV
ncbi:MAG: hypothetical protein SPF94_09725, partial [Desulfovibrio sp.]|nr:hypothetical protein [Desulfovibrio sp.]